MRWASLLLGFLVVLCNFLTADRKASIAHGSPSFGQWIIGSSLNPGKNGLNPLGGATINRIACSLSLFAKVQSLSTCQRNSLTPIGSKTFFKPLR